MADQDELQEFIKQEYKTHFRRLAVNMEIDEAAKMLKQFYKVEVECRNLNFIDDKETHSSIENVAKWLTTNQKAGLLIYGNTGNGKTTLANALCRFMAFLEFSKYKKEKEFRGPMQTPEFNPVKKITAYELAILPRIDEEKYQNLKRCDMLFLDDLGVEQTTIKIYGTASDPFIELLFHRYERMRPTIITSNLSLENIKEKYGDRVFDRFSEMFYKIGFTHKSYRSKQ